MADPVLWRLDDHTRAKHQVLRAYLDAWIPIMAHQALKVRRPDGDPARLLLVDGFAGPGRYETGEDGSPLIMLKALLEHRNVARFADVEFIYLFIEHHAQRFEHLQRELQHITLPANVTVWPEAGEFETTFGRIVNNVQEGKQLIPTFAFVDPFGYSDASMSLAGRFLDFPRCEALIFLPLSFVARFVRRAGQDRALNALFGCDRWQAARALDGVARREFLLDLFETQLQAQGRVEHVRSFEIRTRDGQDYRLVFATGHERGLEVMKDAMWSVDPVKGTRFVAKTQHGQEVLFEAVDTAPLLDQLRASCGTAWFTIEDAERVTLFDTPFKPKGHLKLRTLKPAEKAGLLEVDRPAEAQKGSFLAGVRMRFSR